MTDWPEQFVYVCAAGEAAIVNALPLVHAGPTRVVAAFVLCGARDPSNPSATERTQAIEPAKRLENLIREWCGRQTPVRTLMGDPNSVSDWSERMAEAMAFRDGTFPTVLNLTGGRKQMTLGALLGSLKVPRQPATYVFVGGGPPSTVFINLDGTQSSASRRSEISLQQYLHVYGMAQRAPQESERKRHRHAAIADAVTRFAQIVLPDAASVQAVIDRAVSPCLGTDGRTFVPGPVNPWLVHKGSGHARRVAADAMMCLVGCLGLRSGDGATAGRPFLHADSKEGAELLRGGWIEVLLHNRLQAAFHDRPDVQIVPNVRIEFNEGGQEIGEIDIAVMIKSQIHIIEAKLAHFGDARVGGAAKALAQVNMWKRSLLGQFGQIIVVQPRQVLHGQPVKGSFIGRAMAAGADLALGPNAVEETIAIVERLSRQ